MKRSLFRLAGALAICASTTAQALPPEKCLTPPEMHGLIAYFLPNVLNEVSNNCASSLPPASYLRTNFPRLADELIAGKTAAWPVARSAFFKMSDAKDMKEMAGLSDKALRPLVDDMMAQKIRIPVSPSTCGEVNDISEALAPLSADQTVHLFATILSAVARNDNKMRACPREAKP